MNQAAIGMRRRRLLAVAAVVVVLGFAYCGWRTWQAARAGQAGRIALIQAEAELAAQQLSPARAHLERAKSHFQRMQDDIGALGPILPIAKVVPVVRQQVRGVEAYADAGVLLSDAGLRLDEAARGILEPTDEKLQVAVAVDTLKEVHVAMKEGVESLERAAKKVRSVDDYNLFGPLRSAQADLSRRLPDVQRKAEGAESGLRAMIAFAGGSGPKRYLVLSQNPDEPRPTGGFIGTYGVLEADGKQIRLERYDSIESWTGPRPEAVVPAEQAGVVFRLQAPPVNQTLGNVNTTADWPTAARLAMELWQRGGEAPVDGVVTFTPGLMARILEVTGPVTVPAYDESVSAGNLYERLDFHTHQTSRAADDPARKDFVAALAEVTLRRLLESPASQWDQLAKAVGTALENEQAMAWSTDPDLARELARRSWDGAFPATRGDVFAAGEFSYAAKNGRALQRTYDHAVSVQPDGSARITTTMTIKNNLVADADYNPDSLSYITLYGPRGSVVVNDASDQPVLPERELSGHPASAWFVAAQPLGEATLKVTWDAPDIVRKNADGDWVYTLWWRRIVDHGGDVVNLKVELPPGWKWAGPAPPEQIQLDRDFMEVWGIKPA